MASQLSVETLKQWASRNHVTEGALVLLPVAALGEVVVDILASSGLSKSTARHQVKGIFSKAFGVIKLACFSEGGVATSNICGL